MSTITIAPTFTVDGNDVMDGCFADDVFKGFFAQEQFKDLLALTIENKDLTDINVSNIGRMFNNYILNDLMTEQVGHDLLGNFLQTYDTARVSHVKFSTNGDNETLSVALDILTKTNVTQDERDDRRMMAFGYSESEYDDDEDDFDEK